MATNKPSPGVGIKRLIEEGLTVEITDYKQIETISPDRNALLEKKVENPANNPLMLLKDEKALLPINRLYVHEEIDGTIVYVGEGEPGRAYDCLLRRKHAHAMWIVDQLIDQNDFVRVLETGLTKAESEEAERQHMLKIPEDNKYKFNIQWKTK